MVSYLFKHVAANHYSGRKLRLTCIVEHMTTSMANIRVVVSAAEFCPSSQLTDASARRLGHGRALRVGRPRQDMAWCYCQGQALGCDAYLLRLRIMLDGYHI